MQLGYTIEIFSRQDTLYVLCDTRLIYSEWVETWWHNDTGLELPKILNEITIKF